MSCNCGQLAKEISVDLIRKSDGKVIEDVTAKYCDMCDTYFVNSEGLADD